ncbi:MAG: hypothetical protein H7235_04515 [Bdellovibrionaceae bacterium]|nr:hypothetical protein [Pseudobdellovibrionaceae bacterium]
MKIPKDIEISPLGVMGFGRVNSEKDQPGFTASHTNIKLDGTGDGPSGVHALMNAVGNFNFKLESCYEFDKVANTYGANGKLVDLLVNKLKEDYEVLRAKIKKNDDTKKKSETEACDSCLVEEINKYMLDINSKLGTHINNDGLREASMKGTFEEFLYHLMFPDCPSVRFLVKPRPKFKYFPETKQNINEDIIFEKVNEALSADNPLQIADLCVLRDKNEKCLSTHVLTITGYKESCNKQKKCKKLFKVLNSLGEDWQVAHNDGWVDASSIIKNINPKANEPGVLQPGILSWLE